MPTPSPWLDPALVTSYLAAQGVHDAAVIEAKRAAAAAWIEKARPDLELATAALGDASPEVVEAGLLLAARLHARKGSPQGIASFGEFGPAAVRRFDPDVDRLLGIGDYAPPQVG